MGKKEIKLTHDYDVIIIGAGFSGTFTALELAKDYKILLVEIGKEIISPNSSSYNECYKLHTGLHYIGDKKTAVNCLKNSISFAKEFNEFILSEHDLNAPWRRGRHYLMSNSLFSKEKAKEISETLTFNYSFLIKKDSKNEVFGSSENFIKTLSENDYPYVAKEIPFFNDKKEKEEIHVALGFETPESQIDIKKLKKHFGKKILEHENITFLPLHKVTNISYSPDSLGYSIEAFAIEDKSKKTFTARSIVNCAWQNIEYLDKQLGLYIPDGRINRVKISILVELPEKLKNMNTCIFSVGPYCSITNLGDGTAVLTEEQLTNIGYFKCGENVSDPLLRQIINGKITVDDNKGKELAEKILEGCAKYIPELAKAKIRELRVGFVKIMIKPEETYSIFSINSAIHKRQDIGIELKNLCYISNSGMKMTYTKENAEKIAELLKTHFNLQDNIQKIVDSVKEELFFTLKEEKISYQKSVLDSIIHYHLKHYLIDKVPFLSYSFALNKEEFITGLASELLKIIQNHLEIKEKIKNIKNPESKKKSNSEKLIEKEKLCQFLEAKEILKVNNIETYELKL